MDIEKSFAFFLSAIEMGAMAAAREYAEDVGEGIVRGGFLPAALANIVDTLADERDSVFPFPECFYSDDDALDFRLFIRPEGTMELCCGAPDYDTDHRGFCGAGSIGADARIADIRAAVVDAFSDCLASVCS